jgi:PKD repeat protein
VGGDGSERSVWGEPALLKALIVFIFSLSFCTPGLAMTPAETVISNKATLTCDAGSFDSNTVDVVVAQVAGCGVAPEAGEQTGFAGSSVLFPAVVSNTGNGTDTFGLEASSSAGWPVTVYRDDNGDGVHQTTETTVLTETGPLPMNGQAACVLAVEVPAGISGTSTVTLTARSHYDPLCVGGAAFTIQAILPVAADFSASPTTGPAPLTVQFADTSTGAPTAWSWDFGDGEASTLQNPSHQYAAAGSYSVSLTASNAGGSSTATKNGYITVSTPPPVANFTGTPTTGTAPLTVQFADTSTGAPTAWSWDFGDGEASTLQNPSHEYAAAGSYSVSLMITGPGGSDSETKAGYIAVEAVPLNADFVGSPTSGIAPLTVSFSDLSTGSITSWQWDFGDGASSTEQNPSRLYSIAGVYRVALTVSDGVASDTETKDGYVTVLNPSPLTADFSASPLRGKLPLPVEFTDQSIGSPLTWSWDFGDGGGSTDQDPVHEYETAGHHDVGLTVTDAFGTDAETKAEFVAVSFRDVPIAPEDPADFWAVEEILACVDAATVEGYPDGAYRPAIPVGRGQMAVFIARAVAGGEDMVPTGPAVATFSDVPASFWAYDQVEYCAANNIVTGYGDGTYRPNLDVTRGQMAVFIARSIANPTGEGGLLGYEPPGQPTFPDVPAHDWSYKYVEYLVAEDIVRGYPNGFYRPEEVVTRDQMAVYIAKAFDLLG